MDRQIDRQIDTSCMVSMRVMNLSSQKESQHQGDENTSDRVTGHSTYLISNQSSINQFCIYQYIASAIKTIFSSSCNLYSCMFFEKGLKWNKKGRAGEPANFLAAPAPPPDFFFQAAPAPDFFPSGSGSWFFFKRLRLQGAKNTRLRLAPAPDTLWLSLPKYSFPN